VKEKKKKDTYHEVEEQGTQDGIVMLININIISCLCVILIIMAKNEEEMIKAWVYVVTPLTLHTLDYS